MKTATVLIIAQSKLVPYLVRVLYNRDLGLFRGNVEQLGKLGQEPEDLRLENVRTNRS